MAGYWANSKLGTEANITTALTAAGGQLLVAYGAASSPTQAWINELDFGASGPPNSTDCAINYLVYASTTAPTGGTAATPGADNITQQAAKTLVMTNPTGGNTIGAYRAEFALNQRATMCWVAIPGQELVVPATAGSGYGLGAWSPTYASTIGSSLHFFE